MIFTQEQISEIKQRLSLSGIKDSELDKLNLLEHPLTGKEVITIVKDGENLRISVEDLYEEFAKYEDFFNVSVYLGGLDPEFENAAKPCTLEEAINACPPHIRRAGQMISFLDSHNMKWETYQYIGTKSDDWEDMTLFENHHQVLQDQLDNIIVDVSRYKTKTARLPLGDGYIYYDSSLSYGKYINLERISLAFDDEDGHIEGSRGSDNEPFYIFRNNVGQDNESFDVWDCYGEYHGHWDEYGDYSGPKSEIYDDDEHPIDVIGYIKEILCENLASENKDGLMSAEDKQKLDGAATIVDLKNYRDKDISVLPLNGCYVYDGQPLHNIKLWYNDDDVQCLAFCIYHDDDEDLGGYSSNHKIMYYTRPNGEDNDNYVYRGTFTTNNTTNDLEKEIANAFCCESHMYFIDANKDASFWPVSSYNNYITQHEIDQDKIHIYWQDEKYILWIIDPVEMPEADTLYCILKTNNIYRCVKVKTYATESDSGLMSSSDKQKLDNLPTVFNYSQYCIPNGKIPFNIDFSNYILPCNVEMRKWRDNDYYYLCFAYNELGDIDETYDVDWRLRKNYHLFMLQDASGLDTDNYTYVGYYTNNTVLSDQTALGAKVAEAFGYSDNSSNL